MLIAEPCLSGLLFSLFSFVGTWAGTIFVSVNFMISLRFFQCDYWTLPFISFMWNMNGLHLAEGDGCAFSSRAKPKRNRDEARCNHDPWAGSPEFPLCISAEEVNTLLCAVRFRDHTTLLHLPGLNEPFLCCRYTPVLVLKEDFLFQS